MGVIRKKTARSGEGGVKYVCDVCSADITSTVRIRCAECSDYDLCVQCFSNGQSSNAHKPESHPYRVIEQNSFPIFDRDWGADEELLLIEGAEIYGHGSWADIADHIGGYRTKDEVRDHYLDVYVYSKSFPLPERCSPHDMALANETTREEFQARKKRRIEERREAAKNAPALQPKTKPTASVPSCHEIQGYMPGRLEFETEHANEAEEAVQSMQFDPADAVAARNGDVDPELDLKLTVMAIYNSRLTQRAYRKQVILEHNLLDYREKTKQEKKYSKDEREIINRCKPFARLMNRKDHDVFVQGIVDEHNLRQAISQLQEWRSVRIGDLKSGEKYEQEKLARAQKAAPMGSMDRDRLAVAPRGRAQQAPDPPSGALLLLGPELPDRFLRPMGFGADADEGADASHRPERPDGDASAEAHTNGTANGESVPNGTAGAGPAANSHRKWASQSLPGILPLELTYDNAPDLHLLTPEEASLCETIRVQPKPYIMIKEQILKEALRGNGCLRRKQVKDICRLDPQKGGRIFDFFVHAGWIDKA